MREIRVQNEKIKKILLERADLINQGREISKKIEELEKERNKLVLQADKLRDKIIPFINKIRKENCDRYENIESVVVDGDDIVIKVFDAIEEYKKILDKKIEGGKF